MCLAEALVGLERHQDADAVLREVLDRRPEWLAVRALQAAALAAMGHGETAADAIAALRRLSPRFSVARWRVLVHFGEPALLDTLCDHLRAAGLPD